MSKYEVYLKPYDYKSAVEVSKEVYELIMKQDAEIEELEQKVRDLQSSLTVIPNEYEDK